MIENKRKNEARPMPPTSPKRQEKLAGFGAPGREAAFSQSPQQSPPPLPPPEKAVLPKRPTPNFSSLTRRAAATGGLMTAAAKARAARKPREQRSKFDFPFFTIVIVLLAFGIVMMFSASYAYAHRLHGDSYHYVYRQLRFIIAGLAIMIALSVFDYEKLRKKWIIYGGAAVSLGVMLFVAAMGTIQGGAARWLTLFGTAVQPSEVLKLAVIVVLAYWIHEHYDKLDNFKKGFMPMFGFLMVACVLTLIQPHLSGAIIIFTIGFIMMFVGDCKVKHIALTLAAFAVLGMIAIPAMRAMGIEHFDSRILSWRDPTADVRGDTFQTYQSLITIGSGGLFGLGLGNSRQKYAYLPASHNDFIFSIVCEELGFVGAIFVVLLFVLFIFRGFYIAARARDKFGMLLATGITSQLGVQALLNIGVVTNSVPNTGISLPFFSYGGSALIMQLAGIGVVLSISRKAAIE
jgi:cell division protein FtsW